MTENQNCIDLTYLKELAEGSNEFVVEMITIFLQQTPEMLEQMTKYLNEQKWTQLCGVAHKMKPTIDYMGIHSIRETVETIEKYADEQQSLDLLPGLVAQVNQVCTNAINQLKTEIKKFL